MAKNIINIDEDALREIKRFMKSRGQLGSITNEVAVNWALQNFSEIVKHLDKESLDNLIK